MVDLEIFKIAMALKLTGKWMR